MFAAGIFSRVAITGARASVVPAMLALALSGAVVAPADAKESGAVVRLDQPAGVVMLEGGRMYRVTSSTVLSVDGKPVAFKSLQPGTRVAIENGEPVIYRDHRYIALKPPPPSASGDRPATAAPPAVASETVTSPPVAPPPPAVVVDTPAPPPPRMLVRKRPAAAEGSEPAREGGAPLTVRRTIYGVVTALGEDGRVTIRTDRESFEARLERDAIRDINPGDTVVIDLSISPPGAASPR